MYKRQDIEILAENQEEALAKYHAGDFGCYDYEVSDFTDTHTLLGIREEIQEVAS